MVLMRLDQTPACLDENPVRIDEIRITQVRECGRSLGHWAAAWSGGRISAHDRQFMAVRSPLWGCAGPA